MAGDLLGGLVKGLSGLMSQDDPDVKIINMQTEISDLRKKETELYAEIGKKALEKDGDAEYPEIAAKLRLVQDNINTTEKNLQDAKHEKQAKEKAEQEACQERTCPNCGTLNPEGVKFCQECGTKIEAAGFLCPSCGAQGKTGMKFCQECGTRLEAQKEPDKCFCLSCGNENRPGTKFCSECGTKL